MIANARAPLARAALLFALGLLVHASLRAGLPDAEVAYSPLYKGDAPVWRAYAESLRRVDADPDLPLQARFELGLPLRPPGMGYLAYWFGDSIRWLLLVLGASLAPLVYLVVRAGSERVAITAGLLTASSAALAAMSASMNNEVPYLFVVLVGLLFLEPLRSRPCAWRAAAFGALQGVAVLLRVEHALFAALCAAWGVLGRRGAGARVGRDLACGFAASLLVLLPWHVHAWSTIDRFNTESSSPVPARSSLPWDDAARAAIEALPGFVRGTSYQIVESTVRHRGGSSVTTDDLRVLGEAFGRQPEPLPGHPFVALYGPLNFALANHASADGGFGVDLFARPAPFPGGVENFSPAFVAASQGFSQLRFEFPPHVDLVVHGYGHGFAWMLSDPASFLSLAGRKLWRFWSGVSHGLGASALPIGWSGVRRRVDLAVPDGAWGVAWRLLILGLAVWGGVAAARQRAVAMPWLLWIASTTVVTVAFFGYARQGALCVPAFSVLLGCAVSRTVAGARVAWAFAVTVVLVSGWFAWQGVSITIDGVEVDGRDPWPAFDYADRRLELR